MLVDQVIHKLVQTISNLKRYIYRKREQAACYNKQKDELKTTGAALIHVDYSKATIGRSKMEFRVPSLVSKTSLFLLPDHITVKIKKAIWRRSLLQ